MDQMTFEKNYLMNTVQKTVVILRAFTREEPKLSLTELHKKTGIGLSSLQRFVATLVYEGFLIRDEKTKQYQLGLALSYLGKLVEQESSILTIATPVLQELNKKVGESVSMSIIDGNQRRCVLNFESMHPLTARHDVGDTSPLYAGASAKALLAFLPQKEIEEYLEEEPLQAITENTILDREQLLENLRLIREEGYALSKNERIAGACSVSAPILSNTGRPVASISIITPDVRFQEAEQEKLIEWILEARKQIERQLV